MFDSVVQRVSEITTHCERMKKKIFFYNPTCPVLLAISRGKTTPEDRRKNYGSWKVRLRHVSSIIMVEIITSPRAFGSYTEKSKEILALLFFLYFIFSLCSDMNHSNFSFCFFCLMTIHDKRNCTVYFCSGLSLPDLFFNFIKRNCFSVVHSKVLFSQPRWHNSCNL